MEIDAHEMNAKCVEHKTEPLWKNANEENESWLNEILQLFEILVNDFRFLFKRSCCSHFKIYEFCRVLNNYKSYSISFKNLKPNSLHFCWHLLPLCNTATAFRKKSSEMCHRRNIYFAFGDERVQKNLILFELWGNRNQNLANKIISVENSWKLFVQMKHGTDTYTLFFLNSCDEFLLFV